MSFFAQGEIKIHKCVHIACVDFVLRHQGAPIAQDPDDRARQQSRAQDARARGPERARKVGGSEGALFVPELVLACFPASGLAERERDRGLAIPALVGSARRHCKVDIRGR